MIEQFEFTAADRERFDRADRIAEGIVLVVCAVAAVLIVCGVI